MRERAGALRGLGCINGSRCASGSLRAESREETAFCQFDVSARARWTHGRKHGVHLQRALEPIQTCTLPAV